MPILTSRSEELAEWRLNKLEEHYQRKIKQQSGTEQHQSKKRKRNSDGSDEDEDDNAADETAVFRKAELEIALEEKETELRCETEKYKALAETHNEVRTLFFCIDH